MNHRERLFGSIEDEVEGFSTDLRRRANVVIGAGDARVGNSGIDVLAGGESDVGLIHGGFSEFGAIQALIPKNDVVGSLVVKANSSEFLGAVVVPHLLLVLGQTHLKILAIGVGHGEFEFTVLGRSEECSGAEQESDDKESTEHGRPRELE